MKTVRLKDGVVREIIPAYAMPVEKWYGETFAAMCTEAPDEVAVGWALLDGVWTAPENIPEPVAEPTQLDRVEAQVTYTAILTDTLIPEE